MSKLGEKHDQLGNFLREIYRALYVLDNEKVHKEEKCFSDGLLSTFATLVPHKNYCLTISHYGKRNFIGTETIARHIDKSVRVETILGISYTGFFSSNLSDKEI